MGTELTDQQKAHAAAFDNKTPDLAEINVNHFEGKNFGPWNPYWHVYNAVCARSEKGGKLLSVGCGSGREAIIYALQGFETHGIDISNKAINVCNRLAERYGLENRTKFTVQPAEQLDYPDAFFDVVVGVNVIHHVDTAATIRETARVLKPDGIAIFKEPLLTPVRDKFRNNWLVKKLIPKGTKNMATGKKHAELVPGEKNLDAEDFAVFEENFASVNALHWHVLVKLGVLIGNRRTLERADWALFRILPFIRRFGDQAVFTLEGPIRMQAKSD